MHAPGHADGTFDLLHVAVSIVAVYVLFHVLRTFLWIIDIESILPLYSRDRGVLGRSFVQWTVIISVMLIVWTGVATLAIGPGAAPQRAISAVMTCGAILILVYCIYWRAAGTRFVEFARRDLSRWQSIMSEEEPGTLRAQGLARRCELLQTQIREAEMTLNMNGIQPGVPANPRKSSGR